MQYRIAGRTAASVATAGKAVAILWNPSSSVDMFIRELHMVNTTAATANVRISRTTTRGTPGSTVTPDIDNEVDRAVASPAGAVLDLAQYSVEPTVDASVLDQWLTSAVIGAGKIWTFPKRLSVPPGAGVGLVTSQAVIVAAMDVTFVWDERE